MRTRGSSWNWNWNGNWNGNGNCMWGCALEDLYLQHGRTFSQVFALKKETCGWDEKRKWVDVPKEDGGCMVVAASTTETAMVGDLGQRLHRDRKWVCTLRQAGGAIGVDDWTVAKKKIGQEKSRRSRDYQSEGIKSLLVPPRGCNSVYVYIRAVSSGWISPRPLSETAHGLQGSKASLATATRPVWQHKQYKPRLSGQAGHPIVYILSPRERIHDDELPIPRRQG